ncbi:MAG: hypothetical protein HC824_22455, partial [Synechococcales cyanobacterium RM1_1_8]|nr:hypothetical protein [Synechococcales cyanobacterium RM1_1_8]
NVSPPPANQALIQNPQLKNRIFHHQALAESLPTPQTTPAAAPNKRETWYQSCIGKAGTVVLCDTAHYFHRGRPPIAQDRSAIFYSFFSRRPKHPFFVGDRPQPRPDSPICPQPAAPPGSLLDLAPESADSGSPHSQKSRQSLAPHRHASCDESIVPRSKW